MPSALEAYNASAAVGDWAQTQYVGWGFQMKFRLASNLGVVCIYIDDNEAVVDLNLTTGAAASFGSPLVVSSVTAGSGGSPSSVFVGGAAVPLDIHRVKVVASANNPAGAGIIFPQVTYLY